MSEDPFEDPRFSAALGMLHRTGLMEFHLRWHDEEQPTIWMAVGGWCMEDELPVQGPVNRWDAGAATNPLHALFRLCEQVIDGGRCRHCDKMTVFNEDLVGWELNPYVCHYEWDPELKTYRRACE